MSYSYDTGLGRYIIHGTSTATEKNEFFCILFLGNMSIQQVTSVLFYRPQNGTFLVLQRRVMYYYFTIDFFKRIVDDIYSYIINVSIYVKMLFVGSVEMLYGEFIPEEF